MAMKNSRVPWIGEIPCEWQIRPVKAQYTLTTGFTPSSEDDSLYDDDGETWVTISDLKSDIVTDSKQKIAKSVARQHLKDMAKAGSLLYSFKLSVGTVAFAGTDLYTNEAIAAFQPISEDADLHYLKYASSLIIGNANTNIYGAAIMNQKLILNAPLPVPSLFEQQAIADYLDDRCSKIDEIIAEATASIEEYKELKQAVIFEAVTKGLDKNVPMKDSGYEFIGIIPARWKVTQLKRICKKITDGSHYSPDTVSEGLPYVTAGDVHGKGINYEACRKISNEDFSTLVKAGCQPCKGDVLLVKDGATTGRVGLMVDDEACVLLSSVAMLTPIERIQSDYLMYLLDSHVMQHQIRKSMAGSAMPRTTLTKLMAYVAIDCPIEDQNKIIEFLNSVIPEYDALISEKQALIDDLQEYKKSLIYEVVTGKRRVV